ncbi:MAG TPA: uroporphyrinogen decarboxylase family protein, partial [Planctomycetota bacterium]|nr:uroporphyrinogen decarboxylase family protein [Planctomycetota bacterium]
RELLKPRLARQYAAVRERGKKVFIHSCGKVDEIFDDLVEIGLDCFNPFQPEVIDVFATKERYRGRLAFYGGISTQQLLPYGSPNEVREKVAELIERLGKSGGYIASPAHAIPGDAPAENIHAMIEVLKGQRPG